MNTTAAVLILTAVIIALAYAPKYRIIRMGDVYVPQVWRVFWWGGIGPDMYVWTSKEYYIKHAGAPTEAEAKKRLTDYVAAGRSLHSWRRAKDVIDDS